MNENTDKLKIKWLSQPEEHDYPAAESYLSIIFPVQEAVNIVQKLRAEKMSEFKAKDIFRASRLPLLGVSNLHVEKDQNKIKSGKEISPLLLVRDTKNGNVIIADGYHRLCATYSYDEDAVIPCKIV